MIEPRELAIAALSETFAEQRPALLESASLPALDEALESYRTSMLPIQKLPPDDRQKAAERLIHDLRPIGAKLRPEMGPDQARGWASGIAASMARWPFRVAAAAVKQGVTEPYPFGIGSVDAKLHELAKIEDERHALAIHRLKRMRDDLHAALNPPPAIEQQPKIWTQAEVDDANATFAKIGIKTRYVWKEGNVEPDRIELTADEAEAERQRNMLATKTEEA